jgi:hypothetical protein
MDQVWSAGDASGSAGCCGSSAADHGTTATTDMTDDRNDQHLNRDVISMTPNTDHYAEATSHLAAAETNAADTTAAMHALMAAQVHASLALSQSVDELCSELRDCFLVPMDHLRHAADNQRDHFERVERAIDNVGTAVQQK